MRRQEILDYDMRGGEHNRLAAKVSAYVGRADTRVAAGPADVLDVGGPGGVYAKPLAEAGQRVTVVDPVAGHVAAAGSLDGVRAVQGDARDLPSGNGSADAVLLLGPLHHLQERADRVAAWREAARVVRPGGVVVGATISRFASLFDGFVKGFVRDPAFRPIVERDVAEGRHDNPAEAPGWFTRAYFPRPEEIAGEVAEAGLSLRRVVSVESPLWMGGSAPDGLLEEPSLLPEMLRVVEQEPSLLGASSHLLSVAVR